MDLAVSVNVNDLHDLGELLLCEGITCLCQCLVQLLIADVTVVVSV